MRRCAFTLVELLVVITIIGILIGLLLPAVQSARESGRRTQCKNNLNQLTKAALQHETAHQAYPTGGWGGQTISSTSNWNKNWSGDPNFGTGLNQPGGWTYNILPFLEQQPVHDLGMNSGLIAGVMPPASPQKLGQAAQTTIAGFSCPTRRTAVVYPLTTWTCNATAPMSVAARTDYAANAGTNPDDPTLVFPASGNGKLGNPTTVSVTGLSGTADGVIFTQSTVTTADIARRGTSNLIIFGEKYMDSTHYTDGLDAGDMGPIFAGFAPDWERWGGSQPSGTTVPLPPIHDRAGVSNPYATSATDIVPKAFGSSHLDGLNMFTCDGSGHWLNYNIDPPTFLQLCSRTLTNPIDNSKLGW